MCQVSKQCLVMCRDRKKRRLVKTPVTVILFSILLCGDENTDADLEALIKQWLLTFADVTCFQKTADAILTKHVKE